ncbi:MAG: hypothetical protein ACRDXC_09570 [Acidimicrobiales bacterium]
MVDAGLLYAYVDADDRHHEHPGPLLVPVLVVIEVAYRVESRLGSDAEVRFLGDLAAGNLLAEPVSAAIGYGSPSSSPSTEIYRSEPLTHPSSPQQSASVSSRWRRSIAAAS